MSETRRGARHAKSPDDVFETVGRRARVPGLPEGTGPQMIRAAGLPILTAALVTTGSTSASATPLGESATVSSAARHGASAASPRAASAAARVTYRVKAGDTVSHIAARTGLSIAAIVVANHLDERAMIRIGQLLVLPGPRATTASTPATKPATSSSARTTPAKSTPKVATRGYTVRSGDTLIGISNAHKVTLATVLELNRLTTASIIHPGQKLLLPAPPAGSPSGHVYPSAVTRAAKANRALLAKREVPSRAAMRRLVQRTAATMGVDPALALAVAWQESGFNQRAVSPANAIGTMQVIPGTGGWASDLVGRRLNLLDPEDNVTAGVAVLAALLARAADQDQAIAGYYQGLASVRARGMYSDTKAYVANVKALRKRLAAALAGS